MYLKRSLALLLSAAMALSLAGCNLEGCEEDPDSQSSSSSSESTDSENGGSSSGQESGDSQPQISGNTFTATDQNLNDLNKILQSNPNITTVDFSKITGYIPTNVLVGTKVTKVVVPANKGLADGAFSGTNGLTIEVTGSGSINAKLLEGASRVTLDLSKATIKSIDDNAFGGCTGLVRITFPASLTSIGEMAFLYCTGLSSVDLSSCKNLTSIGVGAFGYCTGLTSTKLPNSLTSIGASAFRGTALTSIDLSGCTNLTTIDSAFRGCTGLTSIDLSGCTSLTSVGPYAFENCTSLASVTFPDDITSIDACAFQGCTSLASVTFSAGLTSIGDSAFEGCTSLAGVTFPASIESIGGSAFANTSLTRIDLSACISLGSIGWLAFSNCDNLTQVILPNSSGNLHLDQNAFQTAGTVSLDLCIPNAGMMLDMWTGEAFTNRIVTLYCNSANADNIKKVLEEAGVKGTGEGGAIQVYPTTQFPGGYGQTGQSLFGLFF